MSGQHDENGMINAPAPTAAEKMSIAHFAPPPALKPYVAMLYHFRCDEYEVRGSQPAALAQIVFLLEGEGALTFANGRVEKTHPASVFGPGMAATQFALKGPLDHVGLALTPLGFVAFTGRAASDFIDQAVAAEALLGPEIVALAQRFREGRRGGDMAIADIVNEAAAFLLQRARKIPPSHTALVLAVTNWISGSLDPDVEQLYDQLPMSRSTVARLVSRYFGCPPKPLMRKYRALRAATALVDPATSPEMRTQIESSFYDQPHMIREIRQFTGCTPRALDGDDAKILRVWLSKDNYNILESYPG